MADSARADSVAATPLLTLLEESDPPEGWEKILSQFNEQLNRVRKIRDELVTLGNPWPETAAVLLTDPDRLEEAENLLTSARERVRPFPPLSEGQALDELGGRFPALALKAADQLVRADSAVYSPLYLHTRDAGRALSFLLAAGRSFAVHHSEGKVTVLSVAEFSEEFKPSDFERGRGGVARAPVER